MKSEVKGFVMAVNGSDDFRNFLLSYNITIGTIFTVSKGSSFFNLVNVTVGNQILSLRKAEFDKLEWRPIE